MSSRLGVVGSLPAKTTQVCSDRQGPCLTNTGRGNTCFLAVFNHLKLFICRGDRRQLPVQFKSTERGCNDRLRRLMRRYVLPSKTIFYETLAMVGQRQRLRALMQDPLERLLRIDDEPVMGSTLEFLESFSPAKKPEMHNMGDVKFRAVGAWHEASIFEFGVELGLFTAQEMTQDKWIHSLHQFPDEMDKKNPNWGRTRSAFWRQIGEGEYDPSSSKSTKIRDPLLRYVHCLLSNSLFQRGSRVGS
jgi:hypothetical protein